MTIKDFKPDQIVYVLKTITGKTTEHFIRIYKVVSVGRKYVRATPVENSIYTTEFYLADKDNEYLTESIDWGNRELLFLTENDVNDYIEKTMLRGWLRSEISERKIRALSLGQLRAIKKILEGSGNEEK